MQGFVQLGQRVLAATGFQLLWVFGPLVLCGVVLHLVERTTTRMLTRSFGWRALLVTGWIGTPIHELSHAALCPLFRHRVRKIALFRPDPRAGVLGYVEHSYDPRSPWATIGNAFIGVAPLFGGALALYALTWALVPGAPLEDLTRMRVVALADTNGILERGLASLEIAGAVLLAVLQPANLVTWQFWLFAYLVVCIGAHMAPSRQDLEGAAKGLLLMLGMLVVANLVLETFASGAETGAVLAVAGVISPVVALLSLAVVLNASVCGLTWVVTRFV